MLPSNIAVLLGGVMIGYALASLSDDSGSTHAVLLGAGVCLAAVGLIFGARARLPVPSMTDPSVVDES